MRADADPTWWTWSSAFGRPAMKEERLTRRSLAAAHSEFPNADGQPSAPRMPSSGLSASSPSTNTVGVPDTSLRDIASVAFSIHCR